jgi:hypothetical protein
VPEHESKVRQRLRACAWLLIGTAIATIPSITQFGFDLDHDDAPNILQLVPIIAVGVLPHLCCAWAAFALTRRDRDDSPAIIALGRATRIAAILVVAWPIFFYACNDLDLSPGAWFDRMAGWRMNGLDVNWFLVPAATVLFLAYFALASRGRRALAMQFAVLTVLLPASLIAGYFINGQWYFVLGSHPYLLWPLLGVGLPQDLRATWDWADHSRRFVFFAISVALSLYAVILCAAVLWLTRSRKVRA